MGNKLSHEELIEREFGFLRQTIGDFAWLDGLTDREFEALHDQIISVFLEYNRNRISREDSQSFFQLPEI